MIFTKPADIRYTDMAIWIDQHAYTDNCDDLTLYQYLYLLVEMFARKHKYFTKVSAYEDFSLFAANYLFERLHSIKQSQTKENGDPRLRPVGSILNYIKSSLFGLKKNFEKSIFASISQNPEEWEEEPHIDRTHIIGIYRSTCDYNACEFTLCLKDLPKCVWETCKRTPYSTDRKLLLNIYTSVLLTILNQITLPNSVIDKLRNNPQPLTTNEYFVDKLFISKEPLKDVILFHVNEDLRNYILYLANRSKKVLARDLSQVIQNWEPSDVVVENLIQNQIEQIIGKQNDEY